MSKFENAPSIRLISLYESEERRAIMSSQFEKYGITDFHFFMTDRYEKIRQNMKVDYFFSLERGNINWNPLAFHGSVITHLENMRHWYLTTSEPYAVFMDDDLDFSTSEYWNFSFNDFVMNLPDKWECVQLIRCQQAPSIVGPDSYDATLKLMFG